MSPQEFAIFLIAADYLMIPVDIPELELKFQKMNLKDLCMFFSLLHGRLSHQNILKIFALIKPWSIKTILHNPSAVDSMAVNEDFTLIAAGLSDGTLRVWQKNQNDEWSFTDLAGHTKGITNVNITQHGNSIVTGSRDKTVRIWRRIDEKNWKSQKISEVKIPLIPGEIAVTKDGKYIAINNFKKIDLLHQTDSNTWQSLYSITPDSSSGISAFNMTPDGEYIVIGRYEFSEKRKKIISIYQMKSSVYVPIKNFNIEYSNSIINTISISDDGKRIIAALIGDKSFTWLQNDVATWNSLEIIPSYEQPSTIVVAPHGDRIAAATTFKEKTIF